jgi:hypothetical protein
MRHSPEAAMGIKTRLLVFRAGRLLRGANRRRRRQLAADLGTYTSEADLNDLYAILATYPDEQTDEIRDLLCRQSAHRLWTGRRPW